MICGGIHKSDEPTFSYQLLREEYELRSIANLTRADDRELIEVVKGAPLRFPTITYPLAHTNQALDDLRRGAFQGAAVLVP